MALWRLLVIVNLRAIEFGVMLFSRESSRGAVALRLVVLECDLTSS
jgi:hypothetical protein